MDEKQNEIFMLMERIVCRQKTALVKCLSKLALTPLQYKILEVLYESDEKLTVSDIKKRLDKDTLNVSRTLNQLVKKELIAKERSSYDQRIVYIALLKKGIELFKKSKEIVGKIENKKVTSIDIEELFKMIRLQKTYSKEKGQG